MAQKNISQYAGSRNFKNSGMGASVTQQSTLMGSKKFGGTQRLLEGKEVAQPSKLLKSNILNDLQPKKIDHDNVEEQYINGLQDEIKLLEYEMKLLKDKEGEEANNFQHFFKFFNDGDAINTNIIAIKNLYQMTQKNLEKRILELKDQQEKSKRSIEYLKHDIENLHEKYTEVVTVIKEKETKYEEESIKLQEKIFDEQYAIEEKEPQKKELLADLQEKKRNIVKIQRDEEKDALKVEAIKQQREKEKIKIAKQIADLEEIILEKLKDKEREEDTGLFDKEKDGLKAQIEIIERKILETKSLIKSSQMDQENKQYELKSLEQARMNDFASRRRLQWEIERIQTKIENETKMTQQAIEDKVRQKEKEDINRLDVEIANIQNKQIAPVQSRIEKLDNELEEMIAEKMNLHNNIEIELEKQKELDQRLEEAEKELHQLKVDSEITLIKKEKLEKTNPELQDREDKLKKAIPQMTKDIEDFEVEIKGYDRQLLLINEIKNFDFEEIKMIAISNQQVNGSINKFLRQWQQIDMQGKGNYE